MDAAVDGIPPIMWEPDRSMSTKMDELRVRINEKYNVDLRKCNLFRIFSAFTGFLQHLYYMCTYNVRLPTFVMNTEAAADCSCTVKLSP